MIMNNVYPDNDGKKYAITFDESLLDTISPNGTLWREFTKEEYDGMSSEQLRALADATEVYEKI